MFINQNDEGLSKMLITVPCTCLREQGFVISICVIYIYVCTVYIREFGHSLCRIDGYSSDANTKIHGDGSAILKILIFLLKVETR